MAAVAKASLPRAAALPGAAGRGRLRHVRAWPTLASLIGVPGEASRAARSRGARAHPVELPLAAGLALAALGGAAYAAGFPPLGWLPAPWLALAPLLVACASLSPARAAAAGLTFATTAALVLGRFLPEMLSAYFGLAPHWSWLATLAAVVLLHGSFVAAFAAWVAWLAQRRAAHPLVVACGWVACEMARAHGALGVPWGMLASSQVGVPLLIQTADLAGPYGLGFVMAAVNACLAACVMPRRVTDGAHLRAAVVTTAALLVGLLAYGAWCTTQPYADGAPVRVALVQAGAPEHAAERRAERLARHVALSSRQGSARGAAPDVIVWPESALDDYLQETSATRTTVLDLVRTSGAELLAGGPSYERTSDGTRYFNSAFLVRDDDVVARYDKHRLVPFAEDGRGKSGGGSVASRYTPGTGTSVLATRRLHAGMLLCFEAMFPGLARAAVDDGADVLVNLSNDGWFGRPEAAQQQLDIALFRAVENRRFLVRTAATGISAVIDPHGRTLARSAFGTHEVLGATIRPSRTRTLYQRWGDAPAWLLIALAALASLQAVIRSAATRDERNAR